VSHIYMSGKNYYDVQTLWQVSENLPSKKLRTLNYFDELLEQCWDEGTRPIEVIATRKGEHWQRCEEANLSYALLIGPDNRLIDGRHRLTKLFANKIHHFNAKVFKTWEEMSEAEVLPRCPVCHDKCFITTVNPDSYTCRDMGHWLGGFEEVLWEKARKFDCVCPV
jgi:hypothetical protein